MLSITFANKKNLIKNFYITCFQQARLESNSSNFKELYAINTKWNQF